MLPSVFSPYGAPLFEFRLHPSSFHSHSAPPLSDQEGSKSIKVSCSSGNCFFFFFTSFSDRIALHKVRLSNAPRGACHSFPNTTPVKSPALLNPWRRKNQLFEDTVRRPSGLPELALSPVIDAVCEQEGNNGTTVRDAISARCRWRELLLPSVTLTICLYHFSHHFTRPFK